MVGVENDDLAHTDPPPLGDLFLCGVDDGSACKDSSYVALAPYGRKRLVNQCLGACAAGSLSLLGQGPPSPGCLFFFCCTSDEERLTVSVCEWMGWQLGPCTTASPEERPVLPKAADLRQKHVEPRPHPRTCLALCTQPPSPSQNH